MFHPDVYLVTGPEDGKGVCASLENIGLSRRDYGREDEYLHTHPQTAPILSSLQPGIEVWCRGTPADSTTGPSRHLTSPQGPTNKSLYGARFAGPGLPTRRATRPGLVVEFNKNFARAHAGAKGSRKTTESAMTTGWRRRGAAGVGQQEAPPARSPGDTGTAMAPKKFKKVSTCNTNHIALIRSCFHRRRMPLASRTETGSGRSENGRPSCEGLPGCVGLRSST